jgi:hypothetical protein
MAIVDAPPLNALAWWPVTQVAQQGWECPKCGRVYSPAMVMCSYCPEQAVISSGTATCTCGTTAVCPVHCNALTAPVEIIRNALAGRA